MDDLVVFSKNDKTLQRKSYYYGEKWKDQYPKFENRVFRATLEFVEATTTSNGYPMFMLRSVVTGVTYNTNGRVFNKLMKLAEKDIVDGVLRFIGIFTVNSNGGYHYLDYVDLHLEPEFTLE